MMTAEELNARIDAGTVNEVIRVAEARQVKDLSRIADDVCAKAGRRLVLVAGGSSAGKTTTAKRLCTQLLVNDVPAALHLSTDDYFVGDARNPRKPDGSQDYEHVECVDIPCLAEDLNALLDGKSIPRRRFDFIRHVPTYAEDCLTLPRGGVIVLEGIHALNPRLTEGIAEAVKYRVAIDPQPNLDVFGGFCPSSAHARFLRRLVRDNQFRKLSPVETLRLWPSVLDGEKKWIDPFRPLAEATFNSYLVYELAALKFYAGGLLERVRRELGEVSPVTEMIRLLEIVHPLSPESIPGDSILRETIGGSQLDY